MCKTAHIVGNGPSWKEFLKAENPGDVYVCNMGHDEIGDRVVAAFIHDGRVFRHFEKAQVFYKWPIITELRTKKNAAGLEVKGNVKFHEGLITADTKEKNSGQDAFHWVIKNGSYKEIHLWGFDSYTKDIMDSETLRKIPDSRQSTSIMALWKSRLKELISLAETRGIRVEIH